MPPWFYKLLQTNAGGYHTLAKVAHMLNNPTTFAKVKQYHCYHKQWSKLEANWCAITAEIEAEDQCLNGAHRLSMQQNYS